MAFVTFDRAGLAFSMALFAVGMNPLFAEFGDRARNTGPMTVGASPKGCLMLFVRKDDQRVAAECFNIGSVERGGRGDTDYKNGKQFPHSDYPRNNGIKISLKHKWCQMEKGAIL